MSILDTFYILFKTDADDAAADIKKVDAAADGAEKGLVKMDAAAAKVGASFVNMARALAAPLAGLLSIGSLTDIAMGRAAAILEVDKAASKLNSSVSQVDAFSRSVKAAGGSTEQAIDSLAKMSEKLNEAFADAESGSRKDFDAWGLAFKDVKGEALGAVDAMIALAGNLENVSRAEALARIKKLGIEDATTIDLLLKGRQAVEDYMRAEEKQGVVTEDQVRIAREYQRELGQTGNLLTSIGNRIEEAVLPAITAMITRFRGVISWLVENRRLVEGFFVGIGAAVTAYYLPAISAAAAATVAATWPFLAVGAAIAAVGSLFALAYEDVRAFMDGQPSLIGKLAEDYEWIGTLVKAIGDAWNEAKAAAGVAIDGLVGLFETLLDAGKTLIGALIDGAKSFIAAYVEIYGPVWAAWSRLFEALDGLVSAFGRKFSQAWDKLAAPVNRAASDTITAFEPVFVAFEVLADKIPEVFRVMVGIVKDIFKGLFGWIADGVQGVTNRINALTSWITGAAPPPTGQAPLQPPAPGNDNAPGAAVGRMFNPASLPQRPGALPAPAASPARQSADVVSLDSATIQAIRQGQNTIRETQAFPAAQVAQAGGAPQIIERRTEVNVGSVTVETQATDARGIASAVKGELRRQLRSTSAQFDDGVDR